MVVTALPSVIGAGAVEDTLDVEAVEIVTITDPKTQPEASAVCHPGKIGTDGRQHLPVLPIVVGFNNIGYNADYNWSQLIFGDSNNHITLNDNGTANNVDSLQEYFRVMSHDKFVLDRVAETEGANDGVIHVTLNYDHWDSSDKDYAKYYEAKAVNDAILTANQYVDVSNYDIDGSKVIENNELMIVVIFAGYNTAAINKNDITDPKKMSGAGYAGFPREFKDENKNSVTYLPIIDGKTIKPYITCPENRLRKKDSDTQTSFGVFARTALNFMGLPNYYGETDAAVRTGVTANEWENYKTNYLSPLARHSGVYVHSNGTADDYRTAAYSLDPWAKIRLGWARSEVVNVPQGGTITKTASALDYKNIGN